MRSRRLISILLLTLLSGACAAGREGGRPARPHMVTRPEAADSAVLKGTGATLATGVMERWIREYRAIAPGVTIDFRAAGSETAGADLSSGKVDFVMSESPDAARHSSDIVAVPSLGSAVVVAYNLPGVPGLRLSRSLLAELFNGSVTRWDDPKLAADNRGTALPALPVKAFHRSDLAGSTTVISRFLAGAVPGGSPGGSDPKLAWPASTGVTGPVAMADALRQEVGTVGFASAWEASGAGLGVAAVQNRAGRFSAPDADAIGTVLISSEGTPDDLVLVPAPDNPAPFSYPLSTFTYLLVRNDEPATPKETAMRNFLRWVLSEGQRSVEGAGSAPMPLPLLVRTLEALQSFDLRPRR